MILKFICRVKTYQKNLEMRDKGEFGLLEFEFIEQIKKLEKAHGQTDWMERNESPKQELKMS